MGRRTSDSSIVLGGIAATFLAFVLASQLDGACAQWFIFPVILVIVAWSARAMSKNAKRKRRR